MIEENRKADVASSEFYVVGGTMPRDAASYIVRQADTDLLDGLRQGQFCYVLTSRQMGKSSLMVRTAMRLREEGDACVVLDLTAIGQNLTEDHWYDGLLNLLARQLHLEDAMDDFWMAQERLSPVQRWMTALRDVALPAVLKQNPNARLVLFVDEIDAVRNLPFAADEFFAAIRELYNRRAEDPELQRLAFCLLGVASPSDLIRDTRTTPFNIGRRIELADFTLDESAPLAAGLGRRGPALLHRVFHWTGGHPYLIQRLCHAVADSLSLPIPNLSTLHLQHAKINPQYPFLNGVDRVCGEMFFTEKARARDENLLFVRERLLRSEADLASLMDLYAKVRAGRPVPDEEASPLVSILKLSGIVRVTGGQLIVRNRIYERVFNRAWARENMPYADLWRQQKAYRRGVLKTALLSAAVLCVMGVMLWRAATSERQAQAQKVRADRAAAQATNSARDALLAAGEKQVALTHAQRERDKALSAEKRIRNALAEADRQRKAAETERAHADAQKREAERQGGIARQNAHRAKKAEIQATGKLWDSYLAQARAARWSGRPGQHFAALDALDRAAKIRPSSELRDEAIAALALPVDICDSKKKWAGGPTDTIVVALDLRSGRFARSDARGNLSICRLADAREEFRLLGQGQPAAGNKSLFSPDGRFLAAFYETGWIRIWNLYSRQAIITASGPSTCNAPVAFSADSRRVAVSLADNRVTVYDLPSGMNVGMYPADAPVWGVALSPNGHRLVFSSSTIRGITLRDLNGGAPIQVAQPSNVQTVAWSPDGRRIATACDDLTIYIWDADTGRKTAELAGHQSIPMLLWFVRDDLLVSTGRDPFVRFWDPRSGRQLLRMNLDSEVSALQFRVDGTGFVSASRNTLRAWEVGGGVACRPLYPSKTAFTANGMDFSADGHLLMTSLNYGGVYLWETNSARQVGTLPMYNSFAALSPGDGSLLTSGRNGLRQWRERLAPGGGVLFDQARVLSEFRGGQRLCVSRDGNLLCVLHLNHADIYRLSDGKIVGQTRLHPRGMLENGHISPDNRWLATVMVNVSGRTSRSSIRVWSVVTGKLVKEFATNGRGKVIFSPDGRWLASAGPEQYLLWHVGSWRLERAIPRSQDGLVGVMAFSADSRMLAVGHTQSVIHLLDTDTGIRYASLEASEPLLASALCFSADGNWLAVGNEMGAPVHLWNMDYIRRRLRAMKLDWTLPPISPKRLLRVFMPQGREDTAAEKEQGKREPNPPTDFRFLYNDPHDADPGWRHWYAPDPTHWIERLPRGGEYRFTVVGRMELEGEGGTLLKRVGNDVFHIFLPDKNSHMMTLRSRRDMGIWDVLGDMVDVR